MHSIFERKDKTSTPEIKAASVQAISLATVPRGVGIKTVASANAPATIIHVSK